MKSSGGDNPHPKGDEIQRMRRFSAVESVASAFFHPGVSHATLEMPANAEPHVAL